jgi:hypothetical protein
MAIPTDVVEEFDPQIRERGHEYYIAGDVRILESREGYLRARVHGSRFYNVMVDFSDGWFDFDCDCPYSQSWGSPCKHVWATILKAESDGMLHFDALGANGRDDADDPVTDEAEDIVAPPRTVPPKAPPAPAAPGWKKTLEQLRKLELDHRVPQSEPAAIFPDDRRIVYLIDVHRTLDGGHGLAVEVMLQKRQRGGAFDRPKSWSLDQRLWLNAPEEIDRMIAQLLMGAQQNGWYPVAGAQWFNVPGNRYDTILRRMCDSGRCGIRFQPKQKDFTPLKWDEAGPWEFEVDVVRSSGEKFVILQGSLARGEERMALDKPILLLAEGLVVTQNVVGKFSHHGAWPIVQTLRGGHQIRVPIDQLDELLAELSKMPRLPKLSIPDEFGVGEIWPKATKYARLSRPKKSDANQEQLSAKITFDYEGFKFDADERVDAKLDKERRRLVRRDRDLEARALQKLSALGFHKQWSYEGNHQDWMLPDNQLQRAVLELIGDGWIVEAEGAIYRRPGTAKMEIRSSGIDWFELDGSVDFDGKMVALPKLLEALANGQQVVRLDDGSLGILPSEWLAKYAPLAGMGEADGDVLKFGKTQIGFLDALLATMPEARCDETFSRVRQELRAFDKIDAADAPEGFGGTLRPYQRDGLGWMKFLQRFNFGGCLADDMGLGKTVQVLALLEERRRAKAGPALVVVPRSLVFNWKAEAQRFTPDMRVLDHTGINRTRAADHFANFDLIVTTYGTLRRDAAFLKDTTFDYVILDEAQAIKNSSTEAAKATRLLRGTHRLVLTGTPIENRLADLWSLFEFLNPGMLGAVSVFRSLVGNEQSAEGRQVLARALRPFILRRTKQQVATDLPEKLEQTIFCDLEDTQRKLYDELREHYRQSLLTHVDSVGINKSKMQVLEALLRLRQAACHPGLIDKTRADESSAKLDALVAQLEDVLAEGHKALVFSQFTSFLSLLRTRLDADKTVYEYLDGKTRDRQAKVERFQSDENCKLFLISLKAGGVGLNLTAADYVFLLDPWWNPAVEAQAIDRTHRIGQTRRVFAYRLIARDTVEEKVLKLQQTKRDLADAIITADNSVISKLGREDLELLLS